LKTSSSLKQSSKSSRGSASKLSSTSEEPIINVADASVVVTAHNSRVVSDTECAPQSLLRCARVCHACLCFRY
jgi:hypothetical protein